MAAIALAGLNLLTGAADGNESGSDSVAGIGNVTGGQAGDTITRDNLTNALDGYTRNDTASGGYCNDTLHGNQDNDQLLGRIGNDWMHVGQGNDTLDGGAGVDQLTGGITADRLFSFVSAT